MRTVRFTPLVAAASLAALLHGCSTDRAPAALSVAPAAHAIAQAARSATDLRDAPERSPLVPPDDVLERAARVRDPFAPSDLAPPNPPRDDRPRRSRRYAVDQLRLAGIVQRSDAPRAMVIDPRGKGWVIAQGDLLGKPETVRSGSGERLASWRVDRIRERDVVLSREVAGEAAVAGITRVLSLPPDPIALDEDDEIAVR
jgi:type IV pilus assembly protein PilP